MMFARVSFLLFFAFSQKGVCQTFADDLAHAAVERTKHEVRYDGAYVSMVYPGGDVPANTGVCTDVVIRSYRALGIDLQKAVHEDMLNAFEHYPSKRIWGLSSTDSNIDHRRVPNLQTFFSRNGVSLPVTTSKDEYVAGDIVSWMLPNNLPHIGIVVNRLSVETGNPLVVHNIGSGPKMDDILFSYAITGHYRYAP